MKNSGKYVLCFVLGSLIGAFVGVGTFAYLSKKPDQQQTKQIVDTSTIDTPTIDESAVEVETETATEIPPKTEPVTVSEVIYEDDNLTITYNGFKSFTTNQDFYFTFDNKSDYYVRAIASDIKINGIAIDQKYSTELESKSSVSPRMSISNSKLQDENISRVNSLEFKMQITVTDFTIRENVASYDTDIMTITR